MILSFFSEENYLLFVWLIRNALDKHQLKHGHKSAYFSTQSFFVLFFVWFVCLFFPSGEFLFWGGGGGQPY